MRAVPGCSGEAMAMAMVFDEVVDAPSCWEEDLRRRAMRADREKLCRLHGKFEKHGATRYLHDDCDSQNLSAESCKILGKWH
jgi:hypothetical protein